MLLSAGPSAEVRLREWCALAGAAGFAAPAWMLPALAPLRAKAPDLIDPIAGPGLDWLARVQAGEGTAAPQDQPVQDWTEGTPAERREAFAAFRRQDPEGARTALQAAFKREKGDLRQQLAEALQDGLGDADEPFLEACLDDRATGVRLVAQRLLARLPGSRFAARMAARAGAALAIESRKRFLLGTQHALVVTLPEESPELARDGVVPKGWERDTGRRAGLLRDTLAVAPLRALSAHPPRLWIELALRSEWALSILDGLMAAIRREDDRAWAREMAAVLGEAAAGRLPDVKDPKPVPGLWARAASLLPLPEWEALVQEAFRTRGAEAVIALLGNAPHNFSEGFSEALIRWFSATLRATRAGRHALVRSWAIGRSSQACAPGEGTAAAAAALLEGLPAESADGVEQQLRTQATGLAETLALRLAMRQEFNIRESA